MIGMKMNKTGITIFGSTGDLTYRKLMPALYNLFSRGLLEKDFDICAIGRRDYKNEDYTNIITDWIKKFARLKVTDDKLKEFFKHINYLKMDFTKEEDFQVLNNYYKNKNIENHVVYLAVAPAFFEQISIGVEKTKCIKNPKIILEKPFGDSLENAGYLSERLETTFGKDNIYRIDHYLGKEMIRNILTIRTTNHMISKVWNSDSIESVHISALEEVGVGSRADYYDETGALMDMVTNHLLQILTIVAMDNPQGIIHEEQYNVLKDLRPIKDIDISKSMILGQHKGYVEEDKVDDNSKTETYAALKLFVDNERWKDVPFFIRTGKKCDNREVEVAITFRRTTPSVDPDVLIIKIQPVEGVYLEFNIKTPGEESGVTRAKMEFCQSCEDVFRLNTPEAYERMILACLNDDSSWFSRWNQIETSWKYIEGLKEEYKKANLPVYIYEQGSKGPSEANSLANTKDQRWR